MGGGKGLMDCPYLHNNALRNVNISSMNYEILTYRALSHDSVNHPANTPLPTYITQRNIHNPNFSHLVINSHAVH